MKHSQSKPKKNTKNTQIKQDKKKEYGNRQHAKSVSFVWFWSCTEFGSVSMRFTQM